jgi:hypothetical protein
MSTKYIINNSDLILPFQEINADLNIVGGLSSTTISATTLYVGGNSITPKYKVYTALLTQSGGDDPNTISSGPVTAGVTYEIGGTSAIGSWDFSNVGGPIYPETYSFVATASEEPNSWVGVDGLNYNNGSPTVTVLENTLGNIWFTYDATGYYKVSSEPESLFTVGKTVSFIGSVGDDVASPSYGFLRPAGPDRFYILTNDIEFNNVNGFLINTPIEIRLYN